MLFVANNIGPNLRVMRIEEGYRWIHLVAWRVPLAVHRREVPGPPGCCVVEKLLELIGVREIAE